MAMPGRFPFWYRTPLVAWFVIIGGGIQGLLGAFFLVSGIVIPDLFVAGVGAVFTGVAVLGIYVGVMSRRAQRGRI